MPKEKPNKRYTGEFKQMVVKTMMRDRISYHEAAPTLRNPPTEWRLILYNSPKETVERIKI